MRPLIVCQYRFLTARVYAYDEDGNEVMNEPLAFSQEKMPDTHTF
jgi:hypothetical protein